MIETEARARARVVDAARDWLGTPYHHAADVIGVGVDCAMILVRVYCGLGHVQVFDPRPYTKDWMLHRDEERYLAFLLARSREVERPEPGDVVLFRVGRCYSHGGIVTKVRPLTIVHALAATACVIEEEVARSPQLMGRLKSARFFSFWRDGSATLASSRVL